MRGRFDFLILHLLSKEEMYGFQIIKKFAEHCTEAEFELKPALYTRYWRRWKIEDICRREPLVCPAESTNSIKQLLGVKSTFCSKGRWYKWESFTNKILDL